MKIIKIATFLLATLGFISTASALNINTADAPTLSAELKGIGMTKAEAIVSFRTEHGPFSEPNDLIAVPGIGPKIIEMIQDQITFEDTNTAVSEPAQ
ncbi:ComEA family DNA-binding protein [Wohlfahrtiimonas populi]|uniref:ComEA family DNA-binding protein n=1 Tax=Wohlfahrtiimonas populi TaxID=1940240 RepID=UPI00098D2839|nr:helix-hairpin-helix domain-containing protein [Wohlfahrtiimonas populi]